MSSLQVENQMLQLTSNNNNNITYNYSDMYIMLCDIVDKLNEELTSVQQPSFTPSPTYSSNESRVSDVTVSVMSLSSH